MEKMQDNEKIGASMGITKNTGNFNSVRLDAWASRNIPFDASEEDRKELWVEVWKEIEGELETKMDEAGLG